MNEAPAPSQAQLATFASALSAALDPIDWERLGQEYCEEGGESFFPPAAGEAIQDTGLHFAGDLGERLKTQGKSLYIGIGVAELVTMLFEAVLLERRVTAYTLPSVEAKMLQSAVARAAKTGKFPVPKIRTTPCPPADSPQCDHRWLASVLTDPDAFPALHDHLYQRTGTREATGRGNLHKERKRAIALLQTTVTWLQRPALVTTSQEELPLLEEALGPAAESLLIPSKARLSAIVGDPLVHCQWVH